MQTRLNLLNVFELPEPYPKVICAQFWEHVETSEPQKSQKRPTLAPNLNLNTFVHPVCSLNITVSEFKCHGDSKVRVSLIQQICLFYEIKVQCSNQKSSFGNVLITLSFVKQFKSNQGDCVAIPITTQLLQHGPKLSVCTCLHPPSAYTIWALIFNKSFN